MRCTQETHIQNSSSVIQLIFPSSPSGESHLRLSKSPKAEASGVASVGVALNKRPESALLDWIPGDSRLWAVRRRGQWKVNRPRLDRRNLFTDTAYEPTDFSPNAAKKTFCRTLHDLLRTARRGNMMVLAEDKC